MGSAAGRCLVVLVPLGLLWWLAFTERAPFFPIIVVGSVTMALAAFWVRRVEGRRELDRTDAGARAITFPSFGVSPAAATLAVGVAIVHFAAGYGLLLLASAFVPAFAATAAHAYDQAASAPWWLAVLLGGVLSAPMEEVFWRGAVQPTVFAMLARRDPDGPAWRRPVTGIFATSLIYGAFHATTGQLALVAAAVLGGLVWGWLLHRTRSLGAVMIAHGLWTSMMLLLPMG